MKNKTKDIAQDKLWRHQSIETVLGFLANYSSNKVLANIGEELNRLVYPGDLYEGDGSDLLLHFATFTLSDGNKKLDNVRALYVGGAYVPLHFTVLQAKKLLIEYRLNYL